MQIVIEEVLIINFFLNFLILKITSFIVGNKSRLLCLSALIGSIFALIEPLWNFNAVIKVLYCLCVSMLIILISFKYKSFKEYFYIYLIHLFTTFLFGGGCFALEQVVGSYPIYIVAITGLALFSILAIIIKIIKQRKKRKNFTYKLTFKDGDKVIKEDGYLDSGNVLYDNITKKPIVLVNFDVFHKFYEDISYISFITKSFNESSIKNGHYIKINSVGKGTSILIFTVDELSVEGEEKSYKNVALGLSFSGFEKSFGANVLLHCDFS